MIVQKLNQRMLTFLQHLLHYNVLMLEILLEEIDQTSKKKKKKKCQSNFIFSREIIPIKTKKHLIISHFHQAKLQKKNKLSTSHLRICSIILFSISDEIDDDDERNCSNRRAIQRRSTSFYNKYIFN